MIPKTLQNRCLFHSSTVDLHGHFLYQNNGSAVSLLLCEALMDTLGEGHTRDMSWAAVCCAEPELAVVSLPSTALCCALKAGGWFHKVKSVVWNNMNK